MLKKIKETTSYIQSQIKCKPRIGIILGTGLGGLVNEIEDGVVLKYDNIPNFPVSTVEGHAGSLIFGKLAGQDVIAMQGRFHYYEGYDMQEVTFPVRVFKFLGIEYLLISNASGGLNPGFSVGDIMVISDHINLFPDHPLRGPNIEELGPRFPDMSEVYATSLVNLMNKVGYDNKIDLQNGVYAGISGPTYETPAEYNYIRSIGADAVGMSTVPEAIVARHMNLPVVAVSVITDMGTPEEMEEISHEIVQIVAQEVEPKMTRLIKKFLSEL
jgi:purine-nucleoside phosphorylase